METKEAMKTQEQKAYVPAQVTIIEIAQEKVLCQSGGTEDYTNNSNPNWFGLN